MNDKVQLFNQTLCEGQTKKFNSFYNGPLIIIKTVSDLNFVIEDQRSKKQQIVPHDKLKAFHERTKVNSQEAG